MEKKCIGLIEAIGDEKQIASGKRPQGTSKRGKWVGHWKQKGTHIYE